MTIAFCDIESNGLLDTITKIHCIGIAIDQHVPKIYTDIGQACSVMEQADTIVFHNAFAYDLVALHKIAKWSPPLKTKVVDTLILSGLIFPEIALRSGMLPVGKRGSHSLAAWGLRLKCPKADFHDFAEYSEEMGEYCKQDVEVLRKVYHRMMREEYPQSAIDLEMELAPILVSCTSYGFSFNREEANILYAELLQKRQQLKDKLRESFPVWVVDKGSFNPPLNTRPPYVTGASYTKIIFEEFNPASRIQIEKRLKHKYDWEPSVEELTETGRAEINEDILSILPYPEAVLLSEYLAVQKLLGSIAEGRQNWIQHADKDGRIHSSYRQCATVTRRSTHHSPNISQVPSCKTDLGKQARQLFIPAKGKVLVDVDQDAVELRCLASYVSEFDKGALSLMIDQGTKEAGTDVHTLNAKAIGCSRDASKTCLYAMLYGCGDVKLGHTLEPTYKEERARKLGKHIRRAIGMTMEGYKDLNDAAQERFKSRGYLISLDGGKVVPRSEYSSLNTLLQSAAAILSKMWIIKAHKDLESAGLMEDRMVAWVHDALTFESRTETADKVLSIICNASLASGDHFKMKCPIRASGTIGSNWGIH